MIERFAVDIIEGVNSELENKKAHPGITGGINGANSIIELMKCVTTLPPLDIVDAFNEVQGHNRLDNMFNNLAVGLSIVYPMGVCIWQCYGKVYGRKEVEIQFQLIS